jgi:hypothetical protein
VPKFGFAKTFVLPGLLIFLVPVLSFLFFLHAQGRYNDRAREAILAKVRADRSLSGDERAKAIAFFTAVPASELAKHRETSGIFPGRVLFDLARFRWAIRLSAWSVLGGVTVLLFAGAAAFRRNREVLAQRQGRSQRRVRGKRQAEARSEDEGVRQVAAAGA